ncbi:unnamed protein product [Leuciscus chuanchicus]
MANFDAPPESHVSLQFGSLIEVCYVLFSASLIRRRGCQCRRRLGETPGTNMEKHLIPKCSSTSLRVSLLQR